VEGGGGEKGEEEEEEGEGHDSLLAVTGDLWSFGAAEAGQLGLKRTLVEDLDIPTQVVGIKGTLSLLLLSFPPTLLRPSSFPLGGPRYPYPSSTSPSSFPPFLLPSFALSLLFPSSLLEDLDIPTQVVGIKGNLSLLLPSSSLLFPSLLLHSSFPPPTLLLRASISLPKLLGSKVPSPTSLFPPPSSHPSHHPIGVVNYACFNSFVYALTGMTGTRRKEGRKRRRGRGSEVQEEQGLIGKRWGMRRYKRGTREE
jgi:hypothetical protein